MTISNDTKRKLAESPEFRAEFVAALVMRAFALQVRTIRQKREWTQAELAAEARIDQGVVSRAENPNCGTTFKTALNVSAGFDLAFVPKIVTFTEFLKWVEEVSSGFTDLPSFNKELAEGTLGQSINPESRNLGEVPVPKKPPESAKILSWLESLSGNATAQTESNSFLATKALGKSDPTELQPRMAVMQ
jgi:transcriptional regulator with XRE-family HTH domain